ncbi:uncharacterized mitochondrial protein AtMg00810-like [Cannabis sativa]|uniref:uncharacterized mitochondrial protein AtMg00810-like n=1 Tax=Cannabis sativa TaxID=3483 RepID=UPI0029CA52C5|nr:uncharacterized mitochondrial protein AtMg00810-like [Cannabis sativa]
METNLKLSKDKGNLLPDPTNFRSLIDKLIYLTSTRPDISYAVNHLSEILFSPWVPHLHDAHRILQHLKTTPGQGLYFPSSTTPSVSAYAETSLSPSTIQISFFLDVDSRTCRDTRRSIFDYCLFFGRSLVSWKSKKQQAVSHSSTEVEYRAMGNATSELTWILTLLKDFGINHSTPAL